MVKAHKNASFCTARNKAFEGECETDFFTLSAFFTFGFKIKPEDFHNVSASRNEGSSLHITKESLKGSGRSMECGSLRVAPRSG